MGGWGGGTFGGVLGCFGGNFYLLEKFRVKYRNIPIIAFRGRSIIVSAL